MASAYKSQGRATKEFGIEFRSKLEAMWAHALHGLKMHGKRVKWEYVDSHWHDFVLHCPWGDARLEIKPVGDDFLLEAVERIPDGETLFIAMGEPGVQGEYWVDTCCPFLCVRHDGAYCHASGTRASFACCS